MIRKFDNLKLTSQFTFCPYAFSLDLYEGCPHRCTYCFSQQAYYINKSFKSKNIQFDSIRGILNLEKIEKYLIGQYRNSKNQITRLLQYLFDIKQPLHVGGMYDPFPRGVENVYRIGKKFLELMNKYQYPVIFSTKNPPVEYIDLFRQGKYILQVSIPFNKKYGDIVEKGALPVEKRFEAIKKIRPYVKKVVVRMQPYIIGIMSDKELEEHITNIKNSGADAVTVEFLKFQVFQPKGCYQMEKLSEEVGINLKNKLTEVEGPDWVYPIHSRKRELLKIKEMVHAHSLEFYSAENSLRDEGDGFACCGINHNNDSEKDFYTKLRYTTNEALFIAKEKGEVCLSDIINNQKHKELFEFKNILPMWNTRNRKYRSKYNNLRFVDFIKNNWNTKSPTNPAIFFKRLYPFKKGGEVCYKYKK